MLTEPLGEFGKVWICCFDGLFCLLSCCMLGFLLVLIIYSVAYWTGSVLGEAVDKDFVKGINTQNPERDHK